MCVAPTTLPPNALRSSLDSGAPWGLGTIISAEPLSYTLFSLTLASAPTPGSFWPRNSAPLAADRAWTPEWHCSAVALAPTAAQISSADPFGLLGGGGVKEAGLLFARPVVPSIVLLCHCC